MIEQSLRLRYIAIDYLCHPISVIVCTCVSIYQSENIFVCIPSGKIKNHEGIFDILVCFVSTYILNIMYCIKCYFKFITELLLCISMF